MAHVTPPAARRTVLTAGAAAGLTLGASACSLIPQLIPGGGGKTSSAPSRTSADPSPDPLEGWVLVSTLEGGEPDSEDADDRWRMTASDTARTDRFGTWAAPTLPLDAPGWNTLPYPEPDQLAGYDAEFVTGMHQRACLMTLRTLLDTPMLFAADDAGAGDVSPEMLQELAVTDYDPHAFDAVFVGNVLTGADRQQAVPEALGFTPAPYDPSAPRFRLLQVETALAPLHGDFVLDGQPVHGISLITTVRGAYPVTLADSGKPAWYERHLTSSIGLGSPTGTMTVAAVHIGGLTQYLRDPEQLPELELSEETPANWQPVTLDALSVALPVDPASVDSVEVSVSANLDHGASALLSRQRGGLQGVLPVTGTSRVKRFALPGAELALAAIGTEGDRADAQIYLWTTTDLWVVQINGLHTGDVVRMVTQVAGGIRLQE